MNVDFMRRLPLFMSLSDDETQTILRLCRQRLLQPRELLFDQGDASRSLFIIEQGSIKVQYTDTTTDQTVLLDTLGPGAILGEMALIDPGPRSAMAFAEERSIVQELSAEEFGRLKEQLSPAAHNLLRAMTLVLCERLRSVDERIARLMKDPKQFIARNGQLPEEEATRRGTGFMNELD